MDARPASAAPGARAETPLEELRSRAAALPRSIWRRRGDTSLQTLPGGIRLALFTSPFIVRWAAWLVALLIVAFTNVPHANERFEPWLLIATFAETLAVTSYVPLLRPAVLPALRRMGGVPENADVLWVGLLDLGLSLLAVYLSGGWGSPYYHFALTALLIPSFFLTFRGVLGLAGVYTALYVIGVAAFGDGVHGSWRDANLNSFIGAVMTPFLVALVPNYLGSVLRELDVARQDAVDALADTELLYRIGRSFLERGHGLAAVLPVVANAARESSRFDAVLLLVREPEDAAPRAYGMDVETPDVEALDALLEGEGGRTVAASTLPAPLAAALEPYAWAAAARLQPADDVDAWMIVATRERPAAILHEVRLLDAMAGQVAMGIRNMRLTARIGELAAEGERVRIAREIHDGIAQMVYMLTLSLETAVDRVGGDPDEQRQRLRDLTALAKNALWEVRQYIFDLRPLLSGDEGLVRAVQGQVREFQAVSELPVELAIRGEPVRVPSSAGAGLYRIVQEGLGNIFRHARASHVRIGLEFCDGTVSLAIEDDGVGFQEGATDGGVGYGMGNLRRRVEELRGTLRVRSAPGTGTRIEVTVPVGEDE
ncbi:MAG TPA: sensor histidine kinase [Dehalococcoidia bacterium]|jgi:signal transduction histidine kinase|nr:sensor histidine kinase [Dehalococcoidia bacterium]